MFDLTNVHGMVGLATGSADQKLASWIRFSWIV